MKNVVHKGFFVDDKDFEPAYLSLYMNGELQMRLQEAIHELGPCRVCPRNCEVDRLNDEMAICQSGRFARVASFHAHLGEEDCLRGWNGSGTIFFSGCNLRCVFCQNFDISQLNEGSLVEKMQLAEIMLRLQDMGCHNINFVTPEHVVPQIIEALPMAIERGLRLPIVYNTSAYDSQRSLQLLDGIVDIYMPDFKFWQADISLRYLKAKDYPQVAVDALKEMHRQVGELKVDKNGIAKRGLLVRHLLMPGDITGTAEIMEFLAAEISPDTYVNIMAQYYPAGKVSSKKYPEINQRTTGDEYREAYTSACKAGLWRFDQRGPAGNISWNKK